MKTLCSLVFLALVAVSAAALSAAPPATAAIAPAPLPAAVSPVQPQASLPPWSAAILQGLEVPAPERTATWPGAATGICPDPCAACDGACGPCIRSGACLVCRCF
jgi:hypothetical protein